MTLSLRGAATLLLIHTIASTGLSETHRFEPKVFYNTFSGAHPPALRIKPGDRVNTYTIDAGGRDATGAQRGRGPNPQTGPFYIEGAEPGDTLVVHLLRLETNRSKVTRVRFWRRTASIRVFCGRKRYGRRSS